MSLIDRWHVTCLLLLIVVALAHSFQPTYNITTVAGGGSPVGDGLNKMQVLLSSPTGVVISNSDTLFCDTGNHRIRKIDAYGVVSTIAGSGVAGFSGDGLNAVDAQLNSPQGIAVLSNGAIIFSDTLNHCIRKIENGIISRVAGTGTSGYTASGTATDAQLNTPRGVAVFNNEIYFADSNNHVIRKINTDGDISSIIGVAGTTGSSSSPTPATNFQMNTPVGVAFNGGTLFFSDSKNSRVCYVGTLNFIIVMANLNAETLGLSSYNSAIYAALKSNTIVSISTSLGNTVTTVAGTGTAGYSGDGGLATSALLNGPSALAFDSIGNMFISDSGNNRIRKVSGTTISAFAGINNRYFGDSIAATRVSLSSPNSVYYSQGSVYIADMNNHVLRRLQYNGYMYNVVGSVGVSGTNNANGVSTTSATLTLPSFTMKSFNGLIYYLDNECAIRRIQSNNVLNFVVGNCDGTSPSGYFTSKSFDISSDGIIYIADNFNNRIAKFIIGGSSLTTLAGGSTTGFTDDVGSSAAMNYPDSVVVGPNDVIYFSDRNNHAIRSVSKINGLVTTIAGTGVSGYSGDGGSAKTSRLSSPGALSVTLSGEIIFMDKGNQRIRKITKYGNIFTIAGTGSTSYFNNANGLTLGESGEIYIADSGNNVIKMLSTAACTNSTNYNSSTFECSCSSGYYGEICSEYDCEGVNWRNSTVCSSRGTCLKPNTCNCSQPYFGNYCEQYTCYGVNVLNSSVCSSNGECSAPDNCTCSFGTFGSQCENAFCQGIDSSNSSACNSRGKCIGYNKCSCNSGYFGSDCEFFDCFGLKNTDSLVCSGNGLCSAINNCTCNNGYYGFNCSSFDCVGEVYTGMNLCLNNGTCSGPGDCACPIQWGGSKCQYAKCFNRTSVDSEVCSGNGQCLSYNNCSCTDTWFGHDCGVTTCYGIMSNSSNVCSSHGSCKSADNCICKDGYKGDECEYRVCYDVIHIDPNVCSSHGSCIAPNNCQCENGFFGHNCQYHQVFMDISKAMIYSNYDSLLNISRESDLINTQCQDLFDSSQLEKLGEVDLIQCYWTSNYFRIMLGFNHLIEHGSTLQLNSNFNISLFVNANTSLTLLNQKTFSSSMDVLLTSIPSTQDFVVKSNSDDYYHTFKKVSKYWTCDSCPQTIINQLNNYENKSMVWITSDMLNSIPLDSLFLKILSLKYTSTNSLQKSITSTDKTRIQSNKNLPPYFTWYGENVKDAQFSCVGHNCIVESSLNSMNSSLSFTFSGFFSLLNTQFSQKQMFRLVNVYNGDLVDSEYSSNAQIVGFQLKTYVSTALSYYFSYTTFDRLDHVLTNLNRTLSINDDGKFTISIFNQDPFISTFTLPEYFTYKYECYQVDENKQITSSNICPTGNDKSLTIDPVSMGISDSILLVNLTLTVSNSFTTIPYHYFGYVTLQSRMKIPKLSIDQLPAIYPNNKDLILKVLIQSSSPITYFKWKLTEGLVKERSMIEQLLINSELISLGSNSFKSEITIKSEYLLEGEFINFDFSISNQNGFSNVSLSTRIDQTPRFSCEFFNLKNEMTNIAFESLLTISCLNLPGEPISSFNMEFWSTNNRKRLNVISNTLKKNIVTRIPIFGLNENVNLIVKLVNRYGSVGQISRSISVSLPTIISSSNNFLISRLNYVNQQYNNLKLSEPLRIDTSNSLNSLMSILIQNQTISNFTRQLYILNSNQVESLSNMLKDMISQLKNIQSLTYKVDEKIIQLVLPTLSQIYEILDIISIDDSWVSDISTWIDWIYNGMSNAKQYYSANILSTILSKDHFMELKSIQDILSNRYSNILSKQELIANYRAKYLLLTGLKDSSSSYVLESVDISSQLNGKFISTINQDIQMTALLPSDLTSQVNLIPYNAQLFYTSSIISNDKTSNNILSNRPIFDLSIYSKDGDLISVNNLNKNPIVLKFNNLFTDYKSNTNFSCVYYDSSLQTWSSSGISFNSTIIKQENGKLYFNMECNTTHLSLFSVQEFNFITPIVSNSTTKSDNDLSLILGLALGISIPLVLIVILIFVIIVIILSVFVWKLKKKSREQAEKMDLEMSGNDFPSDASMFLTPLVSVSGGSSSGSESFNPLSRYLDLVRIGQGAFGSVFRSMDSKTNTMKAIKVIRYQSNEELNGFMKEGTQLMNVNHPNILKVNDFFISKDNLLCIDMDFYEKGDLVQLTLESFVCSERVLLQIIYQMLNALNYIHTSMKLIHRDIKPSNIFIKSIDKEHIHIVIADFGLARADQGSAHKSYAGTPLFMSPELGYGGKYFYNTDIYSLGVTLYQIMTKDTHTSISQLLVTKDKVEVNSILRQQFEECKIYSNEVIELVISMLEKDFTLRPQAAQLLSSPLFKTLQ